MDFKKALAPKLAAMATSALAMGYAGSASAAEWEINVGGYYEAFATYSGIEGPTANDDFEGAGAISNTEIFFLPSITLDNGIKIGANIVLEGRGSTEGDTEAEFDDAAFTIKGSFGNILIGRTDTSYENFLGANHPALFNLSSPSTADYIAWTGDTSGVWLGNDVRRGTLGSTTPSLSGRDNATRIQYFTPRFAGFQLGVSYAHEGTGTEPNRDKLIDAVLNYTRSYDDVELDTTVFYGWADGTNGNTSSPTVFGAGARVGWHNFSIGGSWSETSGSN